MREKLRRMAAYGLLIALGVNTCSIPASAELLAQEKKEYVILLDDPSTFSEILEIEEGEEAENLGGQGIFRVQLTEEEAELLSREGEIGSIEENIPFFGSASDDSKQSESFTKTIQEAYEQSEEWNLDVLGVNDSQQEQQTIPEENYEEVKIAVMDSGVAVTDDIPIKEHVNIVDGADNETSVFFEDTTGHGTSVASVIAAQSNEQGVSGVNPNAAVYSVKVLDDNNSSDLYTVVSGIYWCIDHDINIINMSFGTHSYSKILEDAIQDAANAGILMVAAAGNNGNASTSQSNIDYPAAFGQVIAVGSSTVDGKISSFSSVGEELELFAPGEEVPATGIFVDTISASGSSMSVPHVAGLASILWAKDPSKSSRFIRELLKYSARRLDGDCDFGNGVPDLQFALEQYAIFSDTYTEDTEVPVGNNVDKVKDYTNSKIYAKWSMNNHETLVSNESTSEPAAIMAIAARHTDSNKVLSQDKKFHGNANYVLNLKYLYHVACKLRDTNTSFESILSECKKSVGYSSSGGILTASEKKGLDNLAQDLETVLNQKEDDITLVSRCGANTNLKKAYMVLGIACHLVADTYAHRTVIEKGDYTKLSGIKKEIGEQADDLEKSINQYRVEFRDLKQYAPDKATRASVAKNYEDHVAIYPDRFSVASKSAVHWLYDHFMNKKTVFDNGTLIITDVFANSTFSHKINNLALYAGADNTINDAIRNKSTSVYMYDPQKSYDGKHNDVGYSDYSWSDGTNFYTNSALKRY